MTEVKDSSSEEFLQMEDERLACEPYKNEDYRQFAEQIMEMAEKSSSKFFF